MSAEPGVPGVYTVQIYSEEGQANVIGLKNEEMRKKLIEYMIDDKDGPRGEKNKDWYRFYRNKNLVEVIDHAKILYKYALIYYVAVCNGWAYILVNHGMQLVDLTSRNDFLNAGKYSVLYYVADTQAEYKLCITEESKQKANVESFITSPSISGKKEVDWYRVDDTAKAEKIFLYSGGLGVRGITFNLVVQPF